MDCFNAKYEIEKMKNMGRVNSDIGESININRQWLICASLKSKCKTAFQNIWFYQMCKTNEMTYTNVSFVMIFLQMKA